MRRIRKTIAVLLCVLTAAAVSGCHFEKQEKSDVKKYVKAGLDALYKGDYKQYAECLKISEEDAGTEIEANFDNLITQELSDYGEAPEKEKLAYKELRVQVDRLAKYTVGEVEKSGDDSYAVTVDVEPSDLYRTADTVVKKKSQQIVDKNQDPSMPNVFLKIYNQGLKQGIAKNQYGEKVTVKVHVSAADSRYSIKEEDMSALEEAMFPTN